VHPRTIFFNIQYEGGIEMPTIVHFDIPADDPERAKSFYSRLFGWKFEKPIEDMEYYLVDTKNLEGKPGPGGGLGKRGTADQKMMDYIGVTSVDEYLAKVEELGGKVLMSKTAVPGMGYLAICMDTENNPFGLWEENREAK
jgi:predicted enzyme related to lactoylglutathione lyase